MFHVNRPFLFLTQKPRWSLLLSGLLFLGISFSGIAFTLNPALNINTSGFQVNVGQFLDQQNQRNNKVLYGLSISGMNIGLTKNGFSYTTYTLSEIPKKQTSSPVLNRTRLLFSGHPYAALELRSWFEYNVFCLFQSLFNPLWIFTPSSCIKRLSSATALNVLGYFFN